MRSLTRALLLPLALLLAVPSDGAAQTKIAPGSYQLVPDSTYNIDFDLSGIVLDITETTMTAMQLGSVLIKSTLSYDGNVVTMVDTEGQAACPTASKYRVSVTPKGLRMTPVEDACEQRSMVLAQVTLVKKG